MLCQTKRRCDEGEDRPDEPDARSRDDPDIPEYGCFCLLCFLLTVSRKLREKWAGTREDVHNFE